LSGFSQLNAVQKYEEVFFKEKKIPESSWQLQEFSEVLREKYSSF